MKNNIIQLFSKCLLNLFFILFTFITLIPIIYALNVSFSSSNSLISSELLILPKKVSISNYLELFNSYPVLLWAKNTTILSISTLLLSLTISIPAAYSLSRLHFKFNKIIFQTLILLNAFPTILSMFALWKIMNSETVNLINTHLGLIIIYTGTMSIFGIMNMKGYFDTIPMEIEDAARIDGATETQIVTKIILPLAQPSIIVTSVMILIFVWNEYIFTITFMTGTENFTLAAGLYGLQAGEMSGSWPLFSAAAIIISFPILIIFLLVQRFMISGLTIGGVKS